MTDGTINNGTRVLVSFTRAGRNGYEGPAAIERGDDGTVRLVFPARLGDLRGISTGIVDGKAASVASITQSAFVSSLIVATLVKAEADGAYI